MFMTHLLHEFIVRDAQLIFESERLLWRTSSLSAHQTTSPGVVEAKHGDE
jgi:hypothetical protein